jgi:predicted amidohydrolase
MKKNSIRFAGAQIPCTSDVSKNVTTIKKAIDWAVDNQVDYLLTPEGSLSGYCKGFDTPELIQGLTEVEQYAANKVALCLGTMWVEKEGENFEFDVKRNQIRFYNKDGTFNTAIDKTIVTPLDGELGIIASCQSFLVPLPDHANKDGYPLAAGAFICNDFYGRPNYPDLTRMAFHNGAKIFLHATNADRDIGKLYDKIMDDWHTAHLQMTAYLAGIPVITVDNSCKPDGTEWNGPTSSQSGVLIGGEWVVTVPRTGTHYFYYDLPLDNLFSCEWPNGIGKD